MRELLRPLSPQPTGVAACLTRLGGIRAVLFDVYGTLLVSASGDIGTAPAMDNQGALAAALEEIGIGGAGAAAERGMELLFDLIAAAHAELRGRGVAHPEVDIREIWAGVLRRLADEGLTEGVPEREVCLRLAVEYECRVNPVWPAPGAAETLAWLRQEGMELGSVSNAQFFTPLLFEALLGRGVGELGFGEDVCCWSYEVLEAKPSGSLFEGVLGRLREERGIAAEAVLFVGNDMLNDIAPAAACGCRTALFAGDARSLRLREEEFGDAVLAPDVVVTELRQLRDVVG